MFLIFLNKQNKLNFLQFPSCDPWRVFGHSKSNYPPHLALDKIDPHPLPGGFVTFSVDWKFLP